MRVSSLFPVVVFNLSVLGEKFVTVSKVSTLLLVRQASSTLPCNLDPTDGSPPFCLFTDNTSSSSATRTTTKSGSNANPSCSLQNEDPGQGIGTRYCVCNGNKTLPLMTLSATTLPNEASCSYKSIPTGSAVSSFSVTTGFGPVSTFTSICEICTPVGDFAQQCNPIPGCFPIAAQATVQAGSSPVHVGTLTGDALYTSISSALEAICPPVTQTTSPTVCSTGSVKIPNVPYTDLGLLAEGELVVQVEASSYNVTSLRDAMIQAAALTAKNSATGKNCWTEHFDVESPGKKTKRSFWSSSPLPLLRRWTSALPFLSRDNDPGTPTLKRDHPHPEPTTATYCNAASFASAQYYDPWWRYAPHPGPSDYIDARWAFDTNGGDFVCDFLQDLIIALGVIAPEFATADVQLGKEVDAVCRTVVEHAAGH